MKIIGKLIGLLSEGERKQAALLMLMIIAMAVFDVIGIASIMPFMALLANPDMVSNNLTLASLFNYVKLFGVSNINEFMFLIGSFVLLLLLTSLAIKAVTTYVQVRFSLMREHSIGERLVKGYLYQPYTWYINRNTVELGKNLLSDVGAVVGGGLIPLMNLISQTLVVLLLVGLLLFVDPQIAIVVGLVLGGAYVGIFKIMSQFLTGLGAKRADAIKARYSVVNEAFGAVKEVKVAGLEGFYLNRYSIPTKIYASTSAAANAAGQIPRFVLEAIAFGGMILLVLILMTRNEGFVGAVPTLSLYAFAGYRLMPALQQIYASLTQLRFVEPALDNLYRDLVGVKNVVKIESQEGMQFRSNITLENISFSYPSASKSALNNVSLKMPAFSTIGLVGHTGSGKTTLVDIILGLLEPDHGVLMLDGEVVNEVNRRQWQRSIGYVPQQIFLIDDTVAANIAFGVDADKVDYHAVERAAKIANLHDFIVNELPQGYATSVGERGVRLSGGQRQRIGIARAIFRNPQLLILDEATSALDNLTEQAVMKEIYGLQKKMTIILIAHRLSTVQQCDQIFLINNGQVMAHGTYDELRATSELFMKMTSFGLKS